MQSSPALIVNSTALACPVIETFNEPGEYKVLIHSQSLGLWLPAVLVEVRRIPKILYTDWNLVLSQHAGAEIALQMDQLMDVDYLEQ